MPPPYSRPSPRSYERKIPLRGPDSTVRTRPQRPPRADRLRHRWTFPSRAATPGLLGVLAILGLLLAAGTVSAEVVLRYSATSTVGTLATPFEFENGAGYATEHAEGYTTVTYSSAQDIAATIVYTAGDGGYGSYLLQVIALETTVATTQAWTLSVEVSTALVATGVNAAWISYCTAAPTGVPATGATLAAGTDANGNVWALYAPTCAGTEANLGLTAVGIGAGVPLASGTAANTAVLYISLLTAVTNTGATTTTPAAISVEATA